MAPDTGSYYVEKRSYSSSETTSGPSPDEGYCDITIPAHRRYTLEFDGAEYFEWGRSAQRQASFIWSFMSSVVAGV